jgi:hypothetical protein
MHVHSPASTHRHPLDQSNPTTRGSILGPVASAAKMGSHDGNVELQTQLYPTSRPCSLTSSAHFVLSGIPLPHPLPLGRGRFSPICFYSDPTFRCHFFTLTSAIDTRALVAPVLTAAFASFFKWVGNAPSRIAADSRGEWLGSEGRAW